MHPGGHGAQTPGFGGEVAPGPAGLTAGGVEIPQRGEGQGPAHGGAGLVLLDNTQVGSPPAPHRHGSQEMVETDPVEAE